MASNAGSARVAGPAGSHTTRGPVAIRAAVTLLRRSLALLWLGSIVAVILLSTAIHLGPSLGFEVYAVRGGSMSPAIPVGAAVVAVRTRAEALHVGDIVTVRAENVVFTHRVVEIDTSESATWLRTRGDANGAADAAPVPADAVIGVVAATVPLAGYVIWMLATPAGVVSFLSFAVALLLAISLLEGAERAPQRRRRRAGSPDVARA